MPQTFDPSGANNMQAIKDRITKTLSDATRQMTPTETFAQVGRAASQAATSDVTFGDALNASKAKRMESMQQLQDFFRKEQAADMAERQFGLQEQAGERAERGLGLQEQQLGLQERAAARADEQMELQWENFELSKDAARRADEQLRLQQQSAKTEQERLGLEKQRVALAAQAAVSDAIGRLVPKEERTKYLQAMQDLPYEVDQSNVVKAIGDVRSALEAAGDLPPVAEGGDAKERAIQRTLDANPGATRQEAQGIIDGVVDRVVDPTSGNVSLVNKLTGRQRVLQPELPPAQEPAAVPHEQTLFGLAEQGNVTGAVPAAQEALSGPSGQLGGPVAEDVIQARQTFRTEQQNLIRSLSINPRFPVAEMERIKKETNVEPGFWDNPQTLASRMVAVRESLMRRLDNEQRASKDVSLPLKSRQNAAEAANNIRNFLSILGEPTQSGGAELSPEDEALIEKYSQ